LRIILVDDHALILEGLRRVLIAAGHEIVGEAQSISHAQLIVATTAHDLLVVDVSLPDGSGLELIHPNKAAIVLTLGDDPKALERAHLKGALAYVLKAEPLDQLLEIIALIDSGEQEQLAKKLFTLLPTKKDALLTHRELEIIEILALGWSTRIIASHLFLSEATVKTHLASINRKLGTTSRTAAVTEARVLGLIS
jgi:DNA-binding NarL/FixJ family response regulator